MASDFSVLMSVYRNTKPNELQECIDSLLAQTAQAQEYVLVVDGEISEELWDKIDGFQREIENFVVLKLEKNQGLGTALRIGVENCSNDLIARMDTDDIAVADRFERQLKEFENDPSLDICGGHVKEFISSVDNVVSERKVPLDDEGIKRYQKRRDSFNHMTVMYKKEAVLKAGNYQSCLLMEDTLLWVNMIMSGAKCANIDDFLVYARVGEDMYERRGGLSYYRKYKEGRKRVYATGYISRFDYLYTLSAQFAVALMPNKLRGFIYKKLLRKG